MCDSVHSSFETASGRDERVAHGCISELLRPPSAYIWSAGSLGAVDGEVRAPLLLFATGFMERSLHCLVVLAAACGLWRPVVSSDSRFRRARIAAVDLVRRVVAVFPG